MPFVLAIIGAILVISAIRNTNGDLATALETDAPGYVTWAAAIAGVAALGFIPGMRTVSRMLLALVLVVLVLKNYQGILKGFTALASSPIPATPPATTPGTAYAQATGNTAVMLPGGVSGTTSPASGGGIITASNNLGSQAPSLLSLAGHSASFATAAAALFT